jgi:hypothetical protein
LLLFVILITVALLLLLIYWATRTNSFFHIENIKSTTVLLAIAQSFILCMQAGQLLWRTLSNTPQQYTDFVSGAIGFTNTPKTIEYYVLLFAIVVFVAAFLLILYIHDITGGDQEVEQSFLKLSLYALIPSAIMAGQSLRAGNTTALLNLSSLFIVLSLLIIGLLRFLLRKGTIPSGSVFSVGSRIMLAVLFLVMSEFGMALFLPKLGVLLSKLSGANSTPSGIFLYRFGILTFLIVLLFILVVSRFGKRFGTFEEKLDLGLTFSQVGIPLLFSVLLSFPVIFRDSGISFFRYRPLLYILVFCLGLIAYLDLFRRYRDKQDRSLGRLISPWMLFAILVYLQSYNTGWPYIATDEYHFGEFYLPWWSYMQFGSLPYLDFQPARGLINYLPGLLSWLFYDNTFSGQSMIGNIYSALYLFLAFFGLRKIVGDLVAFLSAASLFMIIGGIAGNLVVVIACLAVLLKASYDKKFVLAFWLWVGFSIFIPLLSIADGSAFILGTLPFGIWLLFQAYRVSSKGLLVSLILFFIAAAVVVLTTRLEDVVISAVRYLLLESGVNDIANGVPWQQPTDSLNMVTTGYLWQLIRFSWLLLLVPIVVRLVRGRSKMSVPDQLFLAGLFIICIFLIPRAAGRIDASSFSRPGLTSIVIVMCALPMVLLPPITNGFRKAIVILLIVLCFGILGNQEFSVRNAQTLYRQVVYEPDGSTVAGETGLHNIGSNAAMEKSQLRRQVQIKQMLDQVLAPGETYFDATNHIADYGFQGREIPVSVPAVYNASSTPVQLRVIDQLEEKKIPLVFVDRADLLFDGGTSSLRSYFIYKYLLENYSPFMDEFGRAWMIRKGEEDRLADTPYQPASGQEKLDLLASKFWQQDLKGLPAAWGNSVQGLRTRMSNPRDVLKDGSIESVNDLQPLADGTWKVSGRDPYIVLSLPEGTKGELLLMELSQEVNDGSLRVFWENDLAHEFSDKNSFSFTAGGSSYIVPVSAAPSWALSTGIQKIRIGFPPTYQGLIHFKTLSLLDRALE